jgi:hypothetical protein
MPVAPPEQYLSWLGLPHEVGADPREGKAACCLVIAAIVAKDAGRPFPHKLLPQLLEMALQNQWDALKRTYYRRTVQAVAPRTGDLHLFTDKATDALGLGTVISDEYMILPTHDCGVRFAPRKIWQPFEMRRVLS